MQLILKRLLPIYKEHNLSSIHNVIPGGLEGPIVVTNIQRTQFKFNSQLKELISKKLKGCYQYTKNTI